MSSSDLVEPEGVDSEKEPPASHEPGTPRDHSNAAPLPMGDPRAPGPGQELEEGEG